MTLATALIYWVIIGLWFSVLTIVCLAFARNPRIFGKARLLLAVILIDTTRNLIENLYFGLYFGSQYGVFSDSVARVLRSPDYLILPKVMNVVAGSAVLGLLILRWLPSATKEREDADATLKTKETALQHEVDARQRLTFFDDLTGLPNRATLRRDLTNLLNARASEHACGLTLAVLDIDRFKDINDTLGHPIGDELLREVALRLAGASAGSQVYRLSEDEFVLLLVTCADPLIATDLIENALTKLSTPFDLDGQQLFITASAGLAIAPVHGSTLEELLSNAELALFDAKAAGGRSQRLFFPGLRACAQRRLQLETELRHAFAHEEFVLYFQSQVRASDGTIVAAEALLRWHHPVHGLLAPGSFIDALAESAVAVDAGRWILENACAAAASWRAKGRPSIRISVNLFPAHLRCGTLEQDVANTLAKTGLPPDALELEITENIALGYSETTKGLLERLRSRGVGISFDDFGTGYASLSCLTRYAVTQIKIDRSFIQKIEAQSSERDAAVVRSILAMARSLRLEVVAEGVETDFQANFLREEGCQKLQGFLFSKPLPASDFERVVRSSVSDTPSDVPARLSRISQSPA